GELHCQRDDVDVLVVIHGRRFAGGTDGHNAVHAALDLELNQAVEGDFVHTAVFERGDNRGVSASEHNLNPAVSICENGMFGELEFYNLPPAELRPRRRPRSRNRFFAHFRGRGRERGGLRFYSTGAIFTSTSILRLSVPR